ncbi:MAG: agmatine deiminase family protein [Phycisphaerae bacterium]|nr:agmatine deiminase family protein [Phycisphaerae bacterium]
MKHITAVAFIALVAAGAAFASQPELVTPSDQQALPKYMTPAERMVPQPLVPTIATPPAGTVRCPAEYEENDGIFFAWEAYTSLLTDMTVGITTNDPDAIVYIVVDNAPEQASATSTLTSAGADMSQVEFVTYVLDSVWIRDYGPRFIVVDGTERSVVDHTYNRPRYNDNAFNDYYCSHYSVPQYDIPLEHGGGNFHLFSNGDAFMTDLILTENPGLSEQDVKDYYAAYQGVDLTIYDGFPTSFDSTQHIDMWMLPVGDSKVIIGQYASSTGQPYTITENAVSDLTSRGYTVYRTPGWNTGGTHYTYTNAVIMNDLVFMPTFTGYTTQNAQALATFQAAMPDHTIIPINCSSIIGAAGALHCIAMHMPAAMPDPNPTVNVQEPNGDEFWIIGEQHEILWAATDDVAVTAIDIYLSTDGGNTFPYTIATGLTNTGSYLWDIPAELSDQCRVKVIAHDVDGNTAEDVSNADFTIAAFGPQTIYDFPFDSDPGWTTEGQWQIGTPTGQGGAHGNPDPTSGATGTYVYGVNLDGDYSTTVGGPYYLTAGPFDLAGVTSTTLGFQRWLNSDYEPYAYAMVEVSAGGSFTEVWANNSTAITDSAWTSCEYDISSIADDQSTVYIRWGYRIGNSAFAYSGWNIDDVQIIGLPAFGLGDMNCDGATDIFDIDAFVLAITDATGYTSAYAGCPRALADCNQDNTVDVFDIDAFVTLLTGN